MEQLGIFGGILAILMGGAITAAEVALGAFVIALAGGMLLAVTVTFARFRLLKFVIAAYIEWMRNVPALAHLFVIYFGLAAVGIRLSPLVAAILGLGLVGAAVLCDVFVAGLKCIHAGQREAALSVGMTPGQTLAHILLPQMFRVTWPSLGNYTSQLLKDTSIASAIAAPEIMFFARNLVTSTFETTLIYLAAMLLYAAMVLPISWGFAKTESRMENKR
ncbi:amino acid ABC transporter permease [Polaromonas sp. JS666]|uniref:amino acid ABC transporter permease n=1 Tax=Polaromonas sp. (strain JS666 / ATCC BAA-500) TaxID=296591 RepID=UPI0000465044|nr:amino acid ABC transporter permease [Polaromonas sp. JS666]ABE43338.1 amino acid ABC transporter membrane protein 1, PAAT family [Polaromonas sp. JS666]